MQNGQFSTVILLHKKLIENCKSKHKKTKQKKSELTIEIYSFIISNSSDPVLTEIRIQVNRNHLFST